jgi:periplasmic copper chaperone A
MNSRILRIIRSAARSAGAAGVAVALSQPAFAQVAVSDAWVRATVAEQRATGAFMKLTGVQAARLLRVESPVAAVVEIHEMRMVDNVMRMRAVDGLELPAGKTVELKPGGYHVMLIDLKRQIKDGDSVPLTLHLKRADGAEETVELSAPVRPLAADKGHDAHQGHKH